jgi:hypothetical protein
MLKKCGIEGSDLCRSVNSYLKGTPMKKINIRKTETLKTTSALYGCYTCPELPECQGGDVFELILSMLGLN